ncbi:hypothetical protein B0H14DRAFT_3559550 [Mycena olivaceomarginata]|nr:hypothetical protein B0H14DRAFT_3559550 [Mycena olivaceomarginata]
MVLTPIDSEFKVARGSMLYRRVWRQRKMSSYAFSLDPDDFKDEGHAYTFNRALELAFQTHKLRGAQLLFTERGKTTGGIGEVHLDMPANQLPSSGGFCVHSTTVQAAENGSLRGCGEAENIWAYNDEGVPWRAEDLVGEASQMRT